MNVQQGVKQDLAIVLLSGGIDSCVTTALVAKTYRVACLHFNYGQRAETRERKCFYDIAKHYEAEKALIVGLPYLGQMGGSSVTDPNIPTNAMDASGTVPLTYVPFRNANFLSVAVSWALIIGAAKIYIGVMHLYPDCRHPFITAFNKLTRTGTNPGTNIEVVAPLIGMSKEQVVDMGITLDVPWHLTWSCLMQDDVPCGECPSCIDRARAFRKFGIET